MSVLCPTCHRPMSAHAPVDALKDARLEPQCRLIVDLLASAYPRAVSLERIYDELYGFDPNGGPDNPSGVVAVRITKLRRQIEPYGWTVPYNRGLGGSGRYRLAPIEEKS